MPNQELKEHYSPDTMATILTKIGLKTVNDKKITGKILRRLRRDGKISGIKRGIDIGINTQSALKYFMNREKTKKSAFESDSMTPESISELKKMKGNAVIANLLKEFDSLGDEDSGLDEIGNPENDENSDSE